MSTPDHDIEELLGRLTTRHLADEQIVNYHDRLVADPSDEATIRGHLSRCLICSERLAFLQRVSTPRFALSDRVVAWLSCQVESARWFWLVLRGATVAALVVFGFFFGRGFSQVATHPERDRLLAEFRRAATATTPVRILVVTGSPDVVRGATPNDADHELVQITPPSAVHAPRVFHDRKPDAALGVFDETGYRGDADERAKFLLGLALGTIGVPAESLDQVSDHEVEQRQGRDESYITHSPAILIGGPGAQSLWTPLRRRLGLAFAFPSEVAAPDVGSEISEKLNAMKTAGELRSPCVVNLRKTKESGEPVLEHAPAGGDIGIFAKANDPVTGEVRLILAGYGGPAGIAIAQMLNDERRTAALNQGVSRFSEGMVVTCSVTADGRPDRIELH